MKFSELNLPADIAAAVESMGFDEMTPVQAATYPIISSGRDLWALAETGSGKTVACGVPLLQKVNVQEDAIQGLVIVPTRELCIQYVTELSKLAANTDIVTFSVFGGTDKAMNVNRLKSAVHILVATPGRLMDLMYSGAVDFPDVKVAILDEADELLKEGFLEDIEFILSCIHTKHQTLLFSATMGQDTKRLAKDILKDPETINLIREKPSPQSIIHQFRYLKPMERMAVLIDYLKAEEISQVIIFCDARHTVDRLYRDLKKTFKNVEYIHGGLTQSVRSSIFSRFKRGKLRYLIATDVAGRGLDFSHVSHIINWDFPGQAEKYTHRTGRTGRMGRKGIALSFVGKRDLRRVQNLLRRNNLSAHWLGKNPLESSSESAPPQVDSRRSRPGRGRRQNRRASQP
ncbi:MAG: DEAD/DEAH box helicase [FCB group bacterium]|nr:DEAD/DEAH box helicase [FCB group bacterium]